MTRAVAFLSGAVVSLVWKVRRANARMAELETYVDRIFEVQSRDHRRIHRDNARLAQLETHVGRILSALFNKEGR